MGQGTELGRVRGLGSAKHGAGHWWLQRLTAFGNLILILWLIISLLRLPNLDYATVHSWLQSPLSAVPMAFIAINTFWHFRLGMQVVIEDYVHSDLKLTLLMTNTFFCFAIGLSCIYAIFKMSFGV